METNNNFETPESTSVQAENSFLSKKQKIRLVGIGSLVMTIIAVMVILFAGKRTVSAGTNETVIVAPKDASMANEAWTVEGVKMDDRTPSNTTSIGILPTDGSKPSVDGIPVTEVRNAPMGQTGIWKNSEVVLNSAQADFVKNFTDYLRSKGQFAIVTSGTRTSDGQLDIIRQRISERGADTKFPKLASATVANTKSWLAAWQWLRARRVPVNAPANVPGAQGHTSMHLSGKAIDFISTSLDQLRGWLAAFEHTAFAKKAQMKIAAIVREPGCVHINLS